MALQESPVAGAECYLYYNTGDRTTPVLVEVTRAINVDVSMPMGEAEIASRLSPWKLKRATLRELELTLTYQKKNGTDTVFAYFQAAAHADPPTIVDLWMLDDASSESGAQGMRAYYQLFDFSHSQELEAVEEVEFVAKATYQETSGTLVAPDWHSVP
jgi:hypothetical protein